MKSALALFFVIQCSATVAQHCATVANSKSKQPVQYATIACLRKPLGTYANDKGEFCIDAQKLSEKDTIVLGGLGYQSLKIPFVEFTKQTSFYLEEKTILLNEVVINKQDYKSIDLGNFKKRLQFYSYAFSPNSNGILSTKIEKPTEIETGIISKIHYRLYVKPSKTVKNFRMRCRIFRDLNGKPGRDVLSENVIVDIDAKQEIVEVDVAKYNLAFDEKYLWLSIETLGYLDMEGNFIPSQDGQFGKYIPRKGNAKKMVISNLSPMFPQKQIGISSLMSLSTINLWWMSLMTGYGQYKNYNFLFGLTLDY